MLPYIKRAMQVKHLMFKIFLGSECKYLSKYCIFLKENSNGGMSSVKLARISCFNEIV